MKRPLPLLLLFLLPLAFSCKQAGKEKEQYVPGFSTYGSDSLKTKDLTVKNEIYYGILTPVQVCAIFDRLGTPYNNDILNPIANKELYLSSSKAAINTGIYGVDFGYLELFGLGQQMIDYMVTIREMSNKLGIPDSYLTEPIKKVQSDMSDPDTILFLMNDSYTKMETHLREGGRESTASLMIMGGWIEAMYIATQLVYDPAKPDPEVVQKIAQQKYTLSTLLSFLKNYYDDPVVVYYSKKLKYLKNYFDSFDIYFKKGDLEIDTARQVLRSTGSNINVSIETLDKIKDYIAKLRTEMVKP